MQSDAFLFVDDRTAAELDSQEAYQEQWRKHQQTTGRYDEVDEAFHSVLCGCFEFVIDAAVDGTEQDDVDDDQQGGRHKCEQQAVEHDVDDSQQKYGDERLVLRQSGTHEFVMNMVLIGVEQRAVVAQSVECDACHVGCGYDEQCESDDDGLGAYRPDGCIVHGALDGEEAEGESQREASRVAHEYLGVALDVAEEVKIKEGDERSHESGNQDGVGVHKDVVVDEIDQEAGQGDECQTGCQSVDAVDEVDGIVDEYQYEDGEWNADVVGYGLDAKESVEVVDVESGHRQQACGDDLHEEFALGLESDEVVDDACQVDDDDPHDVGGTPDVEGYLLVACPGEIQQQDGEGRHHAGKKGDAAQTWYGILVDFSVVWNIVKSLALAEVKDKGRDSQPTNHAQKECTE